MKWNFRENVTISTYKTWKYNLIDLWTRFISRLSIRVYLHQLLHLSLQKFRYLLEMKTSNIAIGSEATLPKMNYKWIPHGWQARLDNLEADLWAYPTRSIPDANFITVDDTLTSPNTIHFSSPVTI